MKKNLYLLFLFLPACFFTIWIGALYQQRDNGQEVKIEIEGYDPRDLLAGHYILYQNNIQSVDQNIAGTICKRKYFFGRHRFYIPQEKAQQLDHLFNSGRWNSNTRRRETDYRFEIVYSCTRGRKPIAKQLLINGLDWRQFLKERNK